MNFKKRIIGLCLLLSLSIMAPETAMLNTITDSNSVIAVVQAKNKAKTKKKAAQKAKTSKKTSTAKSKKEATVYVTATGKCYHTHKCGNGTFYKAKLSEAKASGLKPCSKCY